MIVEKKIEILFIIFNSYFTHIEAIMSHNFAITIKMSRITVAGEILKQYRQLWSRPYTEKVTLPVVPPEVIKEICKTSIEILKEQSLYIEIGYPLTIVGDLHGSINDLFRILRLFKLPPNTNYLFLGDYVDRGANSVAVITLLLCLFCENPIEVTLLRGNHEFPSVNKCYGFYHEVMKIYNDSSIWELFNEVFTYLPLVAVVNEEIICVHGGISPRVDSLDQLIDIPMPFTAFSQYPAVCDLLWSDPTDKNTDKFKRNTRGYGFFYSQKAILKFFTKNKLKLLIRGHQCNMKGVHSFAEELGVTIFSCSNYGGVMRNRCGVARMGSDARLYFYSLGKDTEYYCTAQSIMTLVGKYGLHLPITSPQKPVTQKHTHKKFKKKQKIKLINHSQAYLENPAVKFLREDFLLLPKTDFSPPASPERKPPENDLKEENQQEKSEESVKEFNLAAVPRPTLPKSRKLKPRARNSAQLTKRKGSVSIPASRRGSVRLVARKFTEEEDSIDSQKGSPLRRSRSEDDYQVLPSEKVTIPAMPMILEDYMDASPESN